MAFYLVLNVLYNYGREPVIVLLLKVMSISLDGSHWPFSF